MSDTSDKDSMLLANTMAIPKSTQGVFTLPCGLLTGEGQLHTEVALHEIRGHEEDMLASKTVPDWKKLGELIAGCVTRIGTITDRGMVADSVLKLPAGDRVFLLLAIRRVTLGDMLPFHSKCSSPKEECDVTSMYTIDLSSLDIKKMPDPMKRVGYEAKLPSGKSIRYRVLNGVDEEAVSKATKSKDDSISLSMFHRIELLEDKKPTLRDVKDLGLADRCYIREELFDAIDGGVETAVDMTCPRCQVDFKHTVDVGEQGFFFPSQVRKAWRMKSTS